LAGNAEGFLRAQLAHTGATLATAEVSRQPAAGRQGGVDVVTRALFNPTLDGTRFMVSGTFGFVLSFLTTLITAVSIVNERLTGTFDQLQVTPATSLEIFLGKILPLGAVFAFDVVLMAVVAGVFLGVWPEGNMVFFLVVSAFYVLVSLALGLLISATSATAAEAVQKTVVFSIPLVQLSGFAFPIRNMPAVFRWLTELFPATHYIRLSRAIYLRAEGPLTLLPEIGFLLLFRSGLLISATSATAAEAVQKTVVFSIPLVQLSGFAFPIRNMPAVFRWLTELFPATHYIRLSRAIYLRAEGPLTLLPEIGFLLLFGVAVIVVALRSLETRA